MSASKAAADTVYVLGGPGTNLGKFQDVTGTLPQEQGWVGVDDTQKTAILWNISTFNCANLDAVVPNYAMWCGETFAAGCGGGDPAEGYNNNYDEWLDWYGTVADNTVPTSVRVTAMLNNDSEPGYDFLQFEYEAYTGMTIVGTAYTGLNVGVSFDQTFSVGASDYVGVGTNQVHLRWHATSDGAWSDGDCLWATSGHSQVDDIAVYFNGVQQTYDDFQPGHTVHWSVAFPPSVGDFSKVWPRLADIDPCTSNNSPQFAFIDDGIVVPGTGGTLGTTWTYGPGGYTVNLLGGLAGPDYSLSNQIWSPPLTWPAGSYDGGQFLWNVYTHLPLSNGLFYQWQIRNSTDGGTTWGPWRSDNFVYYGGGLGQYGRTGYVMNTYLTPGRNKVQLSLAAVEVDFGSYFGTDGTPAPYFDNVTLTAYQIGGPGITSREIDLFNDGWPAASEIDYTNLANNSVRVDMARNIAPRLNLMNDPGDSIIMTIAPIRTGSVLNDRPEMAVRMKANPLFDGVRTLPAGFTQTGSIIAGTVLGDTTRVNGIVQVNRWSWDLPDTGFFFPGDSFHYYIKAQDNLAGDIGTTFLPGDTTGFSAFPGNAGYGTQILSEIYKIDALPSMFTATAGAQPHLLFWNDARDRANQNEWYGALDNLGYRQYVDYDVYCTNGPSSGVGNGLGGRTNEFKMSGYSTMLYCASNLGNYTFSNGDFNGDPGNDIAVVGAWMGLGNKNMFATGDNIIQDLSASGVNAVSFRDKWFSVNLNSSDVRPLIGGQTSPVVSPITVAGAPVLSRPYVAFGGCDGGINDFDAITPAGSAVRIAEFKSPSGATGVYPYAAAVYNNVVANTARVVFMPYDLHYIYNISTNPGVRPVRADILLDVLAFFGQLPGGPAVGVTPEAVFAARNYPNPFNPSTKIEFTLPRAGQVELKIYNVRGELVKTLLNENRDAGTQSVVWDGRNSTGQSVSSGVYFYSLKAGSYEKMEKMTLVK
ncbi:MAG: FlgD immunoglobulin-like domain containing protein [Candidatus Krumholzibacteriia bacterium]